MKIKMSCAALFVIPAIAMADVNPKNGDFFITSQDITQTSGDHELNLSRTYNSKVVGIGWFGFGWGTPFETRMRVMPDGTVAVQEDGFGQVDYYAPAGDGNLRAGVDQIVAVASERGKLGPEAAEALRGKLLTDENLRRAKVEEFDIKTELPAGRVAQAKDCAWGAVARINDEYRRTTCSRSFDYFDLAGRLVRQEAGGYTRTIHYEGKHPDRIEDSLGQKLFLQWSDAGHVAEARSGGEKPVIVEYRYDDKDNLALSNERGGHFYRYAYDVNHNMTQICHIDGTCRNIQYDDKGLVAFIAEPDGSIAIISYRGYTGKPSAHYWTTITQVSATGKKSSLVNEYQMVADANGIERIELVGRGQYRQDVVRDERGRVKRVQTSDGRFAEYTYHPTLNKVSAVLNEEGKTDFRYDEAGDLIRAENSQGQLIELEYDNNKYINRMVETHKTEGTRRELNFTYNALKKPIRIELVGVGVINVEYDSQGKILKVESKQGAAMALQVTEAMSALLEIVKVAGVDLRM